MSNDSPSQTQNEPDEDALWEAYRSTTFVAFDGDGTEISRIKSGVHSPSLDGLLEAHGSNTWIFITAWNPGSERPGLESNQARNRELRSDLESLGVPFFSGEGRGVDPKWQPEESFLALGIDKEQGIELARRYGQSAIAAGVRGEPAQLVDCRRPVGDDEPAEK